MTNDMEHLKQETVSGAQLNMDALYQICPQCFTESKDPKTGEIKHAVDFEKLRLLLGDNIAEGDERYDFTWVGKRAALQEAAKPIRKTLRPCPEESVDWENTKNLYIEGDNLEVLKLLQNSYMGKVKMIYIDPPYNTGNYFVYQDDFHQTKQDYDLFSGDVTEEGERLVKNTESNGRFHSDWCSMMYSRLMVARSLLTEDGVIYISIDDHEVENLRKICDEVFGISNFLAQFTWKKKQGGGNDSSYVVAEHEYIISFAKNINSVYIGLDKKYKLDDNLYPFTDDKGDYGLITLDKASIQFSPSLVYEIEDKDGNKYYPRIVKGKQSCWRWSKTKVQNQFDELVFKNGKVYTKYYRPEGVTPRSLLIDSIYGRTESGNDDIKALFPNNPFSYPKPVALIKHFVSIGTKEDSLILDFFSGSSTTAQAVYSVNAEEGGARKFIMVQLPEETEEKSEAYKAGYKNICEIGKERIRRAGKKILEEQKSKQGDLFSGEQKVVDVGFRVFKCADSNMKDVYYAPAEYSQELLLGLEDNIKEDRNDLDLLFGCMLDWGVTLDLPLRTEKVDGINIHIVNEGDLVACFEKHIPESVIDHIASLLPMRVVLRDSCFDEAKEKMNFFEIFKQRTGWSEEEVRKNVKVI
jgi:adenine-specific DNA-methyltransferase